MAIQSIKQTGASDYTVRLSDGSSAYIPNNSGSLWIGAASLGATFECCINDPEEVRTAANWEDSVLIKHTPTTQPVFEGDVVKETGGGITGIHANGDLIVRIIS